MFKKIALILMLPLFISAQTVLPVARDIMYALQDSYRNGEIENYIQLVTKGQHLTEEQEQEIRDLVEGFFNSNQFIETGGAYLSSLFSERELNDILKVVQDPSLKDDPNFGGAQKLENLMTTLKPYIVRYLRSKE